MMSELLDAHRAIKADSPPTESEGPMLETTRRVVAAAGHVHRDLKGTARGRHASGRRVFTFWRCF